MCFNGNLYYFRLIKWIRLKKSFNLNPRLKTMFTSKIFFLRHYSIQDQNNTSVRNLKSTWATTLKLPWQVFEISYFLVSIHHLFRYITHIKIFWIFLMPQLVLVLIFWLRKDMKIDLISFDNNFYDKMPDKRHSVIVILH